MSNPQGFTIPEDANIVDLVLAYKDCCGRELGPDILEALKTESKDLVRLAEFVEVDDVTLSEAVEYNKSVEYAIDALTAKLADGADLFFRIARIGSDNEKDFTEFDPRSVPNHF